MYVTWPHVNKQLLNVCSMIMWTNNYWMYVAWLCEQTITRMYVAWLCEQTITECM